VEFADNSGGSYLQSLTNNYKVQTNVQSRASVTIPGEPTLSLQNARPVESSVTTPRTTAPQPTETSP
jgi:hypothetical protein